jgi:hypothetical protein
MTTHHSDADYDTVFPHRPAPKISHPRRLIIVMAAYALVIGFIMGVFV